jgi:hypothetical protein
VADIEGTACFGLALGFGPVVDDEPAIDDELAVDDSFLDNLSFRSHSVANFTSYSALSASALPALPSAATALAVASFAARIHFLASSSACWALASAASTLA